MTLPKNSEAAPSGIPSWARVGGRVVCVDPHPDHSWLVKGEIYTIAELCGLWAGTMTIRLREHLNPADIDGDYYISRFRPLVTQQDDIEAHFKALLDVPDQVDA